MQVLVGTSGYSYSEWKGSFYPETLKASEMLRYYAERLPTVEINNTFYRMPSEKTLAAWSEQVPDDFSFVLKASRRITHQKRLVNAAEELSYLLRTASVLGRKLGPILFQLPPYLKKDAERLREFLGLIPPSARAAFEFRHPSWFDEEIHELLRSRNAALVVADAAGKEGPSLAATATFGYLRLRREEYDEPALASWARRIGGQPWERAHVFFKHEEAGAGPKLAARFSELMRIEERS